MENNIQPTGTESGESFDVNLDSLETALEAGTGSHSGSESGVLSNSTNQAEEFFEIDERFKGLDPGEARFRTIQSRYDVLQKEKNQLLAKLNDLEPYQNFVNQVLSDEKMAIALVNKLNPNLVPKRDMSQVIKARLKEKFGDGFKPQLSREEAEREDPGGKDWQYYRALDEITRNATEDDPQHGLTIEQYKQKIDANRKAEQEAAKREIEEVKKKFSASDEEIKATVDFLNKLSFENGLRVHRLLRRVSPKIPGITNISGHSPGVTSDRDKFVKSIFG